METPLLATKLFVPQVRPGLLPRPRLVQKLEAGLASSFALVSAPAGFGKTTILAQWIGGKKPSRPATWLQLDDGDNDPVRFWEYVIAAVRTVYPDVGEDSVARLRSPEGYSTEAIVTSLVNDLALKSRGLILVMDDYHVINSEAIHDYVAFLVDHIPPTVQVVIATRADPGLPTARWRGRGSMVEIAADDLRFTEEEAASLLRLQGIDLRPEHLSALNDRAEGWAVGLRMAAMAMLGRSDVEAFVASFTGNQRYVMDFLIEEVLARQPRDVRDFLLETSVLEKMTAPLCDVVIGRGGARTMLDILERSNLFLVPLDDSRRWFRYHHLFADLLRHQLEIRSGDAVITKFHQEASKWYEEQELIDDSIHHAIAARDWDRAMRLIGSIAEDRFKHGEIVTVFEWLSAIPESVLSTDFTLYLHYARTLIETGRLDAGEVVLGNLERAARGDADLQGEVAAMQADVAQRRGNIPRSIDMGEKALSLLSPGNLVYRSWTTYALGFNQHYMGFLDEGFARLSEAFELAQRSGDRYIAAWCANFLAAILHERGELTSALSMAQRGLEIAGPTPAAAGPNCRLAIIPYELNDLKTATDNARRAIEWNRLTGDSASVIGYVYLALALLAGGDGTGAGEAMEQCDQATRDPKVSRVFHARHVIGRVMFAIRQGDLGTASTWGRRLADYPDCLPFEFAHVPARLLIAQERKNEAAEQLRTAYDNAARAGAEGLKIGIRVCQSLAAENENEANSFVTDALEKGEREGYVRTFVDEGLLLAPLLQHAVSRGITPQYAGRLLSIIEDEELQKLARSAVATPSSPAAGLLTSRELDVLRLVADGLSNQEIADKLTVSLNTAKTHVYRAFAKLEARDRVQALRRARELELI